MASFEWFCFNVDWEPTAESTAESNYVCAPVEQNALKEEVNELQFKQEQLECLNTALLHQVDRLREEKEEREREVVSYYYVLEV